MELLKSEKHGEVLILIFCEDEFSAALCEKFKEESLRYIEDGNTRIALDLSRVRFMDSSGLGAMLFLMKKANQKAEFGIFGMSRMVRNLLKITKTDRAFRIFENMDAAVSSLSS